MFSLVKPNLAPIAMLSATKNPILGVNSKEELFMSPVDCELYPKDPDAKISPLANPPSCALTKPSVNTATAVKINFS